MSVKSGQLQPSNASKERSGTHAELLHRAERLEKASAKIIDRHQSQDEGKGEVALDKRAQTHFDWIRREAQKTREFVASRPKKLNAKGRELKSNVTDNESAKMATSKGVIQGYAAQASVDSKHQVIVAADVLGSGSEQAALLPMVEASQGWGNAQTVILADAGYHSDENLKALKAQDRPAMIADVGMRKRDERFADQGKHKAKGDALHDKSSNDKPKVFRPEDFEFKEDGKTCICPAGKALHGSGEYYIANGLEHLKYKGTLRDCVPCELREQCLAKPEKTKFRQVAFFPKGQPTKMKTTETMRQAIDTPEGRALYSKRMGTVEPVFANLRHNKRLNRFTLRGKCKVSTQWHLYCMVHNIEKIANR